MKKKLTAMVIAAVAAFSVFEAGAALAGNGTKTDPYRIGSYGDLVAFAAKVNGGETNACAVLTADITATGTTWTPIGVSGSTASEPSLSWTAYQNFWKRADTKAAQPVFKSNVVVPYELGDPDDVNNKLTLTFKKDGVVAFAGKVGGASVSGSSQLVRLAEDGLSCQVTLYAPPKPTAKPPFDGFCKTFAVMLTIEADIVTKVELGDGPVQGFND